MSCLHAHFTRPFRSIRRFALIRRRRRRLLTIRVRRSRPFAAVWVMRYCWKDDTKDIRPRVLGRQKRVSIQAVKCDAIFDLDCLATTHCRHHNVVTNPENEVSHVRPLCIKMSVLEDYPILITMANTICWQMIIVSSILKSKKWHKCLP